MQLIKKVAVGFLVLALSFGIFYIFQKDRKIQKNMLRTTLSLFGDELLAMVPDGASKAKLQQRYKEFMREADNNQVSPAEIEHVAAKILNLTGKNTEIDPQEALAVLEYDPVMPEPKKSLLESEYTFADEPISARPVLDHGERERLAERLREMHELKLELNMILSDSGHFYISPNLQFTADSGLRVSVSPRLKAMLVSCENPELKERILRLEQEKVLQWKQTAHEIEQAQFHLESVLNQIPGLQNLQIPAISNTVVKFFKTVNVDTLANLPPDSVENYIKIRLSKVEDKPF
ncbi:hypothetical protein JW935_29175 [candidate division KSB1 bacterium]|nr:hypothetical protein [candidate division KSB1 bacterium]